MSYRSGGYKSPFVGVGIIFAVLIALSFAARGLGLMASLTGMGAPTTPESAERQLFGPTESGPLYRTLKRTYPQEFAALVQNIVRHAKAGETNVQIDEAITTNLIDIGKRHRNDVVQAPHDRFADYRKAEISVVETLRDADPQLCATYVMSGAVRTHSLRVVQAPLFAYRIAALEAGAAGRDRPANRAVAAPSLADIQQLGHQMIANGTSESTAMAFLNGTGVAQLSPVEQCFAGLSFYRAVAQMPGDKADLIYAYLISRAA